MPAQLHARADNSDNEQESDEEVPQSRTSGVSGGAAEAGSVSKVPQLNADDSDTEEESEEEFHPNHTSSVSNHFSSVPLSSDSTGVKPSPSLFTLSDRAQMEAERLARRKRMSTDEEKAVKRARFSAATTNGNCLPLISQTFYDGQFFPTATTHANPRADKREAIEFKDILGPSSSDFKFVILSSFGIDGEWLHSHFDASVPVILVNPSGTEQKSASVLADKPFLNWVQTCPKLGYERSDTDKGPQSQKCMHMKFILLFYRTGRLRVVVSTANLIHQDWKHLENFVFVHDFLLRSTAIRLGDNPSAASILMNARAGAKPDERFEKILETVLVATNVVPALELLNKSRIDIPLKSVSELSERWDWTMVTGAAVLAFENSRRTGHPRLMRAIETLGLSVNRRRNLVIECQGSSIGTYTTQWFNEFYLSASGLSRTLKSQLDISESKRRKLAYPEGVKVLFPTLETVKSTSQRGAGSLFCKRKQWEVKNFPRNHFYDSKSRAGPALMHTKMIIATTAQTEDENSDGNANEPSPAAGWMYVGSHNFTAKAWGNLSGSASSPILNVNNYELGVVIPLSTLSDIDKASVWERPAKKYDGADIPW
ncbi:tyrosyl-DNA phosphodiesterase-domain-containing protein, partial [Mycena rebaudengoi]